MGDLTANFSRHEYACQCGCGFDEPDNVHASMVQKTRTIYGRSLAINSGNRCDAHNKAVGGKANGEHTTGEATDHPFKHTLDLFHLVDAARKAGFERIGIDFAKKFVHLGSSTTKPTPRLWGYATK